MNHKISRRALLFGKRFAQDESGATALEYGLIGAIISVVSISAMKSIGFGTKEKMRCTARSIKGKKIGKKCKKAGF